MFWRWGRSETSGKTYTLTISFPVHSASLPWSPQSRHSRIRTTTTPLSWFSDCSSASSSTATAKYAPACPARRCSTRAGATVVPARLVAGSKRCLQMTASTLATTAGTNLLRRKSRRLLRDARCKSRRACCLRRTRSPWRSQSSKRSLETEHSLLSTQDPRIMMASSVNLRSLTQGSGGRNANGARVTPWGKAGLGWGGR